MSVQVETKNVLGEHATPVASRESCSLILDSQCMGWILLTNPDKSVNVVDLRFLEDLNQILSEVERLIDEGKIRVVIFYSEKSSFIVGADVKSIYPVTDPALGAEAARRGQMLFNRIAALKVPTVAAFNGNALGGGLELGLACTHRVASSSKTVSIGLPEIKLGLLPGAGGTVRLPKTIGLSNALGIILPGGSVNAAKAKKQGLVDKVLEHEDRFPGENRWFHGVRSFAGSLMDKPPKRKVFRPQTPIQYFLDSTSIGHKIIANMAVKNLDKNTKGKYPAPYKALESVMYGVRAPSTQKALEFEARSFGQLVASPESKNLISLFLMTEDAKRLMAAQAKSAPPVTKVSVIGAGVMGSGIAQMFAYKKYRVYMKDVKQEFVDKGLSTVSKLFHDLAKRRKLTKPEAEALNALVQGGVDYAGMAGSQVIVEAAVERMDLKKKILADCERAVGYSKDVIFATNTSSLSVNELASAAANPENVVGMHFFNPVSRMPLVEIIRAKQTSEKAVAMVYQLALALGKTPVIVNDGPGFLVNRVLGIYMGEAGRMLQEGGDILEIDKAILDFGMPMGPFRLMDEVGLDVAFHVQPVLEQGLGSRFAQNVGVTKMVQAGLLGKKVGKGFYQYDAKTGKSKGIEPTVAGLLASIRPSAKKHFSLQEIIDRCVLLMVNEAAYILQEGVAERPQDVDLGMVMGTGFAPFRGGLLKYADDRGIANIVQKLQELNQKHTAPFRFTPCQLLVSMAAKNAKFFPERPNVPYVEGRKSIPRPRL